LVRRGRSRGAKSIPEAIMVSIRRSDYQPTLFPTAMDSADDGLEMQKSPRAIAKQYSAFNVQDGRVTLPPPAGSDDGTARNERVRVRRPPTTRCRRNRIWPTTTTTRAPTPSSRAAKPRKLRSDARLNLLNDVDF
jgi:hypothetical protein